jgi:hypothetical protein
LTNTSGASALNVARLVGTSSVDAAGVKAVFRSSTGDICTATNVEKTSINCSVGGLALGESKQFTVTFTSPTAGTNITFEWTAVFDNGTPPGNSNGDAGRSLIALNPISNDKVVSDVPVATALTFFTGIGKATTSDTWVTKVKLPAQGASTASTATIVETVSNINCEAQAPDLLTCSDSTLTIPGSTFGTAGTLGLSQFLEVTVLRDASTIAKGAKIASAVLYYQHDSSEPVQIVLSCTDTSDGQLPKLNRPCEDRTQRYAYPRKSTGKVPVEAGYEGDWKFVVYLANNGRIRQ